MTTNINEEEERAWFRCVTAAFQLAGHSVAAAFLDMKVVDAEIPKDCDSFEPGDLFWHGYDAEDRDPSPDPMSQLVVMRAGAEAVYREIDDFTYPIDLVGSTECYAAQLGGTREEMEACISLACAQARSLFSILGFDDSVSMIAKRLIAGDAIGAAEIQGIVDSMCDAGSCPASAAN